MTEYPVPGFPEVPDALPNRAKELALVALQDSKTPQRLSEFYDPSTNQVGRTFVDLEPRDPARITAADLLATSMLDITFPAHVVRRLLSDTETQRELSARLQTLPQRPLASATAEDFQTMRAFYYFLIPLLSH